MPGEALVTMVGSYRQHPRPIDRERLEDVSPEGLPVAPDRGMTYLARDLAFRTLEALVAGTRPVETSSGSDADR